ncbi:MAG: cupredoxin domain-containing protein, partial [Acidimicrobiia bacterium]
SGGDDVYLNNAGGNLIDVRRGPPGTGAPSIRPARGCVNPAYDLLAGECVISEALLVESAGNDTYGQMQPPDPNLDGLCTDEPLVHRIMTGGVGSWGVGILLDGAGDDSYLGKSITLGAGHFGGVGMLLDQGGNDSYLAIRLAKGFGTLFGLGVFHDVAGNDSYSYYLPRALNPDAPDRTLGAGGALDTGGTCDRVSRWEEGSGFLGGVGVFFDDAGDDRYEVAAPEDHEPGASEIIRLSGSLGFGDGGFGLFFDGSGTDSYTGMPDRADGQTVGPSDKSQGFFHDAGGGAQVSRPAAGPAGPAGASMTAWFTHYIPETVTIDQGGSLVFFNPDLYGGPFGGRAHTITEDRPEGPPRFDVTVPWGMSSPIGGTEQLPVGRYPFTCRIHPFMHGTLVVR